MDTFRTGEPSTVHARMHGFLISSSSSRFPFCLVWCAWSVVLFFFEKRVGYSYIDSCSLISYRVDYLYANSCDFDRAHPLAPSEIGLADVSINSVN